MNVFNVKTPGPITAVALPPVADSLYEDFTLEPAMVRVRAPNSAVLVLDSIDTVLSNQPPVNATIASPGDGILMRKPKRVGLRFVKTNINTLIINKTNNILYMYRSSNLTVYTLELPLGDWNTPQLLCKALYDANITAATGVTFTFFFKGSNPPNQTVSKTNASVTLSTSEPIVFLSQSPAIIYGDSTFGWTVINTPFWNGQTGAILSGIYNLYIWTSMVIGPMPCCYTRYVDYFSPTLTAWTKLPSATSKAGANSFMYRQFLEQFQDYDTDPGIITVGLVNTPIVYRAKRTLYLDGVTTPITFTVNPNENINTVQITLRDEYGRDLNTNEPYVVLESTPGNNTTTVKTYDPNVYTGGLSWTLGMYAEL